MKRALLTVVVAVSTIFPTWACTNIIVTKGASSDGSSYVVYTCDGEFHPHLSFKKGGKSKEGEIVRLYNWETGKTGSIPQAPYTYSVVGPNMNEFQVSIGETTFDGRKELFDTTKALHYWQLMQLALERSRTAREAISVITTLVETYGYGSTGESFSIADPNEAWLLEMIGGGPNGNGPVWVAMRVPDGYICAHANHSRIGEFPLYKPDECIYSKNVISFAIEKGYYNPSEGKPFQFNQAYDPDEPTKLRYCETRVWSIFNRAAPSLNLSMDYNRGVQGAQRYPLWIKPDRRLSLNNIFSLIRDHYEGTSIDMTKGLAAGPFGSPNYPRPLTFKVDTISATWERAISTYNTGFSFVAQMRSWLPNSIGGVLWYGVDDTYTTCYFPLYAGITDVPKSFKEGTLKRFSMNSAWWIFNGVANLANVKYCYMVKDIQKVQQELERDFQDQVLNMDKRALELKNDPERLSAALTEFSVESGNRVFVAWTELFLDLLTRYNDGYVQDSIGNPQQVGYPADWYRYSLRDNPTFAIPIWYANQESVEPSNF